MSSRSRFWTALRSLADAAGYAMLIADARGRVLHETPALHAMAANGEADAIREAATELLAAAPRPEGAVAGAPLGQREVRTPGGRFALRGCLWAPYHNAPPVAIVSVERASAVALSEPDLREAFAFTATEARVALLLGRGRTNAEIAEALSISPHTARRHTERVLSKLDVRSRAEVAVRLLS